MPFPWRCRLSGRACSHRRRCAALARAGAHTQRVPPRAVSSARVDSTLGDWWPCNRARPCVRAQPRIAMEPVPRALPLARQTMYQTRLLLQCTRHVLRCHPQPLFRSRITQSHPFPSLQQLSPAGRLRINRLEFVD